jgi:hypothetical protein
MKGRHIYTTLALLLLIPLLLFSQEEGEEKKKAVKLTGSASLSSNFYSAEGIAPRQPNNLQVGILRASISLYDRVELPFELYYSNGQTQFQQPFNQFGISPRISDWLTLHAGYFSAQFSDLTFGDLRMLGGGFELTPGNFRLKAVYGRTRQAVEPIRISYSPEVYKQYGYAASIGFGNLSKSFFNINLFHAIDDSTSVMSDSLMVAPNENLVGTFDFGVHFSPKVLLRGEVGFSAFSANTRANGIGEFAIPSWLFTPNSSTRVDGAARVDLNIAPSRYWSVMFSSRWIGPGFSSLGYSLMPNDLMEITVSPRLRLFKNRLMIRSKAGIRYNNLRDNRSSTTSRFTGLLAANWQISKKVGLDVNFNKNQIESLHKNDTLRLSNVYNSFSISPRFSFNALGGNNNLVLTYNYQDVSDKNVYTSKISDNNTHSGTFIHSLSYKSSLSITSTLLYNQTQMADYESRIIHFSETLGRRFFKNKLNTSFSLGANFIQVTSLNAQLVFKFNTSYNLGKYGTFSFYISNNNYRSDEIITQNYSELYGSLQYNISF